MLSISSKSKYGILAVLSLAAQYGQGLLQIKDLSSLNNIPQQYLVQIFNLLVKADVIQSVRGKNGGYKLSRPPAAVTTLEVLEILEGGIDFMNERQVVADAIYDLFAQAETQLRNALKITLADLLDRQQKKSMVPMFDI
ncbi:MAG: Rrf2 family transcriptional regulator [Desulfobulbaceae bacterium]|nr:Rrf2 family transcriptional regulator [Desulfobulbaceae bacterium]HIJ77765.1 Rrf2 family transcriptional regulator [Deltaproteobacteria bacterium]